MATPGAQLPAKLDAALKAAVDAAVDASSAAQAVGPVASDGETPEPFDSEVHVFKGLTLEGPNEEGEGESIGKQIADLAQERFSAWIVTGKFTAFASTPSPMPNIPWGTDPEPTEEEEEEDEDEDEAGEE